MFWIYWILGLLLSVIASSYIVKYHREVGYTFLVVLLAGFILISNILVPRLIGLNIGEWELSVVTGSLLWPFTAQLSDMINEIYGKHKTLIAFAFGYLINILFVVFVMMADNAHAVWSDEMETFWKSYFLPAGRVFMASTVSFIVCQIMDAYIFSYLKEKWRSKEETGDIRFILKISSYRNVLSDVINMCSDGIIFTIIAFLFTLPFDAIITIIISSIIIKVSIAIVDTPLFALFKYITKNEERYK